MTEKLEFFLSFFARYDRNNDDLMASPLKHEGDGDTDKGTSTGCPNKNKGG